MAYNVRNINVLDLRPSIGIGVALPFNAPTAFKTVYTTKEQLKYNLINYLLTDQGERVFNPTFGAGLRSKLFEAITKESTDALEYSLRVSIESNFPTITITELQVLSYPDSSLITINFSYTVNTSNESDNISLNIQNG